MKQPALTIPITFGSVLPIMRGAYSACGAALALLAAVSCKPSSPVADHGSGLDVGLIAHWSFESAREPGADASGNGHHGKAEGTVSLAPGRVGNALDVSGGENFIRVAADPDVFRFGPGDAWSMAGWIKVTGPGSGWQGVVTKSRDQGHWLGMWISKDGEWHTGGGAGINIGTVSPNQWYHWALVHEPRNGARAEIRLYVNGKLLQTAEGYPQRCGPGDLLLGNARTPESDEVYNGLLDEIRIYDRVLGEAEIRELANAG